MDELDRIDRSIDIDAPAERVWALISQPGWWINDGTIDPDQAVDRESDDVVVVHHDEHGDFRIRTVELDQPRYAAFRWLATTARGHAGRVPHRGPRRAASCSMWARVASRA